MKCFLDSMMKWKNMSPKWVQLSQIAHKNLILRFLTEIKFIAFWFTTGNTNNLGIAYEHYRDWKDNTDLIIGANYLTSLQMFWVASAVVKYNKFHKTVPKNIDLIGRLQNEYFHVWFKSKKGFQEAFECNITENEKDTLHEGWNKFYEIQRG